MVRFKSTLINVCVCVSLAKNMKYSGYAKKKKLLHIIYVFIPDEVATRIQLGLSGVKHLTLVDTPVIAWPVLLQA